MNWLLRVVFIAVTAVALALAAALLGVYHHYNRETLLLNDAARHSDLVRAYGGSYVRLPAGITHYELVGPMDAQTVVLVHGFSVPYYIWDPTFHALVGEGFRVLRYDLYGRGWSDRPDVRYDPEFYDQQLVQLLGVLGIRNPIDLVGASMGGPIAVNYAARHPERTRKVALIDPGFSNGFVPPWKFRAPLVSDFVMCVQIAPTLPESQRADFLHPERYADYFARYEPQMRYRGFRHALLSSIRDFLSRDTQPAFEQVGKSSKPVLLIWGRADQDVPFAVSDDVRRAIPQAQFHAIDDSAHVPFYEHPEIVNPILFEFLRR
jgi:pimeloyl-ACP methyl ester carboxylesterase